MLFSGLTVVLGISFIIAGILILLYFSQAVDAVIKSVRILTKFTKFKYYAVHQVLVKSFVNAFDSSGRFDNSTKFYL